jgi:hypothetical protein
MQAESKQKKRRSTVELPQCDSRLSIQQVSCGGGNFINVVTDPMNDVYSYNIGNSLWGASIEVVEYLEEIKHPTASLGSAVEIGAGCGCLGLTLWRRGCKQVVLTDLDEMLPIMNHNIAHNRADEDMSARALDWSDGGEGARSLVSRNNGAFDLIVGAEVTYDDGLHEALLGTLAILSGCTPVPPPAASTAASELSGQTFPAATDGALKEGQDRAEATVSGTTILLAIPCRDQDEDIVEAAMGRGFTARRVKLCAPSPNHSSPVGIYEFRPPQFIIAKAEGDSLSKEPATCGDTKKRKPPRQSS